LFFLSLWTAFGKHVFTSKINLSETFNIGVPIQGVDNVNFIYEPLPSSYNDIRYNGDLMTVIKINDFLSEDGDYDYDSDETTLSYFIQFHKVQQRWPLPWDLEDIARSSFRFAHLTIIGTTETSTRLIFAKRYNQDKSFFWDQNVVFGGTYLNGASPRIGKYKKKHLKIKVYLDKVEGRIQVDFHYSLQISNWITERYIHYSLEKFFRFVCNMN